MLRERKKAIICWVVTAVITVAILLLSVFVYRNAFWRLIQSARDFGLSVATYFCFLFEIPNQINVPINDLPIYNAPSVELPPSLPDTIIPQTFDLYKVKLSAWGQSLINGGTYSGFFGNVGNGLELFLRVLLIVLPAAIVLFLVLRKLFFHQNTDWNQDTIPLQLFKSVSKITYQPLKRAILYYFDFLQRQRIVLIVWLVMWLYNLNLIGAVLGALAWVFYFVVTFDFLHLYLQVYKVSVDFAVAFSGLPVIVWVALIFALFLRWRQSFAQRILNHRERQNRGFLNDLPLVIFGFGTMGAKKTMTITDMALSYEALFRREAFTRMLKIDLKFPDFPWIVLEKRLQKAMKTHAVYNLATVKNWCDCYAREFMAARGTLSYFEYDWAKNGIEYNNGSFTEFLFDAVKTYAQLYFIYVIESSLLISNYAIRSDSILRDYGNFPLWDDDFFNRDPRLLEAYSRHSHILDYDTLRLGRKLLKDNERSGAFEFGVVAISEIGKERGNALELQGVKKDAPETNQKNDLFNERLKMARHSATVDYYPFVRFLVDDQRPESWGADARDLCTLFSIRKKSDSEKLALPFFSLEGLLCDWVCGKFNGFYSRYRNLRGDNCLFVFLLKTIVAKISHYSERVSNNYGYNVLSLSTESGRMNEKPVEHDYFLCNKKILARRYSTDCYSEVFERNVLAVNVGIADFPEYETEKATFSELSQQNSYFVSDLLKVKDSSEDEKARRDREA